MTGIMYVAIRIAVMKHFHIGNIPDTDMVGYAAFGFIIWPALLFLDVCLGLTFGIAKTILGLAAYLSGS